MDVLFRLFNSFSRIPKKHGQRISGKGFEVQFSGIRNYGLLY